MTSSDEKRRQKSDKKAIRWRPAATRDLRPWPSCTSRTHSSLLRSSSSSLPSRSPPSSHRPLPPGRDRRRPTPLASRPRAAALVRALRLHDRPLPLRRRQRPRLDDQQLRRPRPVEPRRRRLPRPDRRARPHLRRASGDRHRHPFVSRDGRRPRRDPRGDRRRRRAGDRRSTRSQRHLRRAAGTSCACATPTGSRFSTATSAAARRACGPASGSRRARRWRSPAAPAARRSRTCTSRCATAPATPSRRWRTPASGAIRRSTSRSSAVMDVMLVDGDVPTVAQVKDPAPDPDGDRTRRHARRRAVAGGARRRSDHRHAGRSRRDARRRSTCCSTITARAASATGIRGSRWRSAPARGAGRSRSASTARAPPRARSRCPSGRRGDALVTLAAWQHRQFRLPYRRHRQSVPALDKVSRPPGGGRGSLRKGDVSCCKTSPKRGPAWCSRSNRSPARCRSPRSSRPCGPCRSSASRPRPAIVAGLAMIRGVPTPVDRHRPPAGNRDGDRDRPLRHRRGRRAAGRAGGHVGRRAARDRRASSCARCRRCWRGAETGAVSAIGALDRELLAAAAGRAPGARDGVRRHAAAAGAP